MNKKLTRKKNEKIVINFLKSKYTPVYNVMEIKIGHYQASLFE